MGKLREANPYSNTPSAFFGFADWPKDGFILVDDIAGVVLTRNLDQGFGELYTFDEWNVILKDNKKLKTCH